MKRGWGVQQQLSYGSFCRATAAAQDPLVALAQLPLEAELREVEEACRGRLGRHVLLIRQRVRMAVRVVIALAMPQLRLLTGMAWIAEVHRDLGRAMLTDPRARPVERRV